MLLMAGIDYKGFTLEEREGLAFGEDKIKASVLRLRSERGVRGCAILSTCNRTELYLEAERADFDIKGAFIKYSGADRAIEDRLKIYRGTEVVYHLMETACGINSAIKGESCIITQVSRCGELSRSIGCFSSELDVLFRTAVSAARGAVTGGSDKLRLTAAHKAVELLEKKSGALTGKKCLVIGSGAVGRLSGELMSKRGAEVTITLRQYKHGENIIPQGCKGIPYGERAEEAAKSDIVISATKSPHFTLTRAMTEGKRLPPYIIDLAVPRDIDPDICRGRNISLYNIDDFVSDSEEISPRAYTAAEKGVREYMNWYNYRESVDYIEEIKEVIAKRIIKGTDLDRAAVEPIVSKTADMIFGGIKNAVNPRMAMECRNKIRDRARI